jgi:hypothetical protein
MPSCPETALEPMIEALEELRHADRMMAEALRRGPRLSTMLGRWSAYDVLIGRSIVDEMMAEARRLEAEVQRAEQHLDRALELGRGAGWNEAVAIDRSHLEDPTPGTLRQATRDLFECMRAADPRLVNVAPLDEW